MLLALTAVLAALPAHAQDAPPAASLSVPVTVAVAEAPPPVRHHPSPRRLRAARTPASLSLGYPNGGRLQNAARLEEDDSLRIMPRRRLHYGTDELVTMLHRVARTIHRRHHVRLTVGDLSAAGGGPVGHHASHQSGRDADVAFFVVDRHGAPVTLDDFLCVGGDGRPLNDPHRWHFDTPTNWALVEALLDDPIAHVEHLFVSRPVRALLLAYARAVGASQSLINRAELTLHQPSAGAPHTNHFHVRIACPAGDVACVEGVRLPPRPRRRPREATAAHRASHADRAAHAAP